MKPKCKLSAAVLVLAGLAGVWLIANPPGRFGWAGFGWAVYGAWPRPLSDLQVRADGALRKVPKTHHRTVEQIQRRLESTPRRLARPAASG